MIRGAFVLLEVGIGTWAGGEAAIGLLCVLCVTSIYAKMGVVTRGMKNTGKWVRQFGRSAI